MQFFIVKNDTERIWFGTQGGVKLSHGYIDKKTA